MREPAITVETLMRARGHTHGARGSRRWLAQGDPARRAAAWLAKWVIGRSRAVAIVSGASDARRGSDLEDEEAHAVGELLAREFALIALEHFQRVLRSKPCPMDGASGTTARSVARLLTSGLGEAIGVQPHPVRVREAVSAA
jgi:hypothetical protein